MIYTCFLIIKMATSRIVYTIEERVDMVRFYFENGNSAAEALRKWKTKYGRNQNLTDRSLQRYVIFAQKSVKFSKFNKIKTIIYFSDLLTNS